MHSLQDYFYNCKIVSRSSLRHDYPVCDHSLDYSYMTDVKGCITGIYDCNPFNRWQVTYIFHCSSAVQGQFNIITLAIEALDEVNYVDQQYIDFSDLYLTSANVI